MDIPYCQLEPTPKQKEFLDCDTKECFFGGAAGGGKSVALLMAALQYVNIPGYSALIIRKDLPRLELAGGLIPRSHEWLSGKDNVRWNASRRSWVFDHGFYQPATLTFGYLSRPLDKYRYASSEFHYIAFDELTDFQEDDYLFLFSRLRRSTSLNVELRMRSASNPGGMGRLWVKQRFIDGAIGEDDRSARFMKDGRCYIPARIEDNEHLSAEEYRESLAHLPPVEREQLLHGDWDIQEDGIFKPEWLRYFVERSDQLELLTASGEPRWCLCENASFRFVTIDPAGTSAQRAREASGQEASWSVIQVWEQPRGELSHFLILRDQVRGRFGMAALCEQIETVAHRYSPARIWIEGEKLGTAVVDLLGRKLPNLQAIPTRNTEKVARAAPLMMKMSRGEVFLPRDDNGWRAEFEAELLAWTGHPRQTSDQIDAAAYAAIIAGDRPGEPIKLDLGRERS